MRLQQQDVNPKKTAVLVIDLQNDFCHEKSVLKRKRTRNRRCAKNVYKFLKTAESKGIEVVFSQQIYDPSKLTWRQKKYYQKIITGKRRQFGAYTGKIKIPWVAGTFGAEYFNYNPPKSALFVKNNFDIWQNKKFAKFLDKK